MTDRAPTSADPPARHETETREAPDPTATDAGPASRFGEAAHLLDRLDLRPQALRQRRRPWWRFW